MTQPTRPAHPRAGEQGAVLVLVTLALVVLFGMTALAIDVGDAMLHKRRLQAAVDLAVLAGSQKLPDPAAATADTRAALDRNWATRDRTGVAATVTTGCRAAGCAAPDKVSVDASAVVPTSFARVLGFPSLTVHARAAACSACDTSPRKFDVMVVVDRSYSMCLDSRGAYNGCYDLQQAVLGVRTLLGFFDPAHDRIGLAALSSGDDRAPFAHSGAAYPCDSANPGDTSRGGSFAGTAGDFMDGTPGDHDSWVLAPLSSDFKSADGTLDPASPLVSTLTCLKPKLWTPIAPAVQAATQELVEHGRSGPDVTKVIVFLGDGGANVQPMQRDRAGNATGAPSWYTASPGNDLRPCHDAVGQAQIAKAAGIEVYTIGYDLNASTAQTCFAGNHPSVPGWVESGIDATSTLREMATDPAHFHLKATPGELSTLFSAIGRDIVSGGSRLVE